MSKTLAIRVGDTQVEIRSRSSISFGTFPMRRCNQLDRLWRARLAIRKCWLRTQATCLPNLSRRHPCSIRGGSLLTMDLDAQLMLGVKEGNDVCMDRLSQRYRGPVIHYIFN